MGVVQEIDLVLSQQSLATLEADLSAAGDRIGTGLAGSAPAAAKQFSDVLMGAMRDSLASKTADINKQLADGILSPDQFATKAAQVAAEVSANFQKALASGQNMGVFTGEGGAAMLAQLQEFGQQLEVVAREASRAQQPVNALTESMELSAKAAAKNRQEFADLAKITPALGAGAGKSTQAVGLLRNGLVGLALSATGVPGPLGRIAQALLLFAGGGTAVLLIAGAIGAIGLAVNKLTAETIKSRDEAKKLVDRFKDFRGAATAVDDVAASMIQVQAQILAIQGRLAQAAQRTGVGLFLGAVAEFFTGNLKKDRETLTQLQGILGELTKEHAKTATDAAKELAAKRKAFTDEAFGIVTAAGGLASAAIADQLGKIKAQFVALGKNVTPEVRDAFKQAVEQLEAELGAAQLGEQFARQLKDIDTQIVEGMGSEALQNIVSQIDALRAQVDAMIALLPKTKERDQLEQFRNGLIEKRNALQQKSIDLASTESLIVQGEAEAEKDLSAEHDARLSMLREQAQAIQSSAQGALQLAEAFGLVDENVSQVLQSLVQVGTNMGIFLEQLKAANTINPATGKPLASVTDVISAGLPIVGGVASAVKGIGGLFGDSPETKAMKAAIEKNSQRLQELGQHLDAFNLNITGRDFSKARTGLGAVLSGQAGAKVNMFGKFDEDELVKAFAKVGTSMKDMQAIADELGIDIEGNSLKQWAQLKEAIDGVDLTRLTEGFEGIQRMTDLSQRVTGATDLSVQDRLRIFQNQQQTAGSTALSNQFMGIDTSTEAGLKQLRKRLTDLMNNFANLTAEDMGGLTREQFLEALGQAGDLVTEGLKDMAQKAIDASTAAREGLLKEEDAQVQAAHEAERAKRIMEAVAAGRAAGGEAASLANQIATAEDKRKQLESGPLGKDSPLAQEQRRIIDELLGQLGAATGAAGGGADTTPGFTVQRTLTQASAGEVVGNLQTINVWLSKIYDVLSGGAPDTGISVGAPAAAGAGGAATHVNVMLDGEALETNVSARQFRKYQMHSKRNGNARGRG